MSETKKTRAGAATPTRAVENVAACKTAQLSTKDSIISAGGSQPLRIADFLHPGSENAVTRRQLMAMTGLSDRALRLIIQQERLEGCPILSDNVRGYFLPGDQAERDRCVRSLRSRAREIQRTADAIEGGVSDWEEIP